jgi:transcriptional regulator with XRE-family HTH domain
MLGIKLLGLAEAVGLTQTAIAEHLGVAPPQVNRWAKGVRAVPEHIRTALTAYVLSAVRHRVDELDASLAGSGPLRQVVIVDLRRRLMKLADECLVEDMEAAGEGPTAAIRGGLEVLAPFAKMSQKEMLKSANAARLLQLAEALRTQAALLCRIAPMFDVLKEGRDADDRKQSPQFDATGETEPSAK